MPCPPAPLPSAPAGVSPCLRRARSAALASALLSLAAFTACADPAPEAGCTTAADCPAGQGCAGGSCSAPPDGGGGSGGSAPVPDECGASADCIAHFASIPTVIWDGSLDGADPLCTVPQRSCPAGSECDVATVCTTAAPEATRLGGMRCEWPEQCASGRCVENDGVSLCLRACGGNVDCPSLEPPLVEQAVGFTCGTVVDEGVPLRLCLPIDPAFPGRTLCTSDCDCVASDDCTTADGSTLCRFTGVVGPSSVKALPLCNEVDPALPLLPTLAQCLEGPEACHGGGCTLGCAARGSTEGFCFATNRCTQPCASDTECPERATCQVGRRSERVGTDAFDAAFPGRDARYCQLAQEGCFDEQDCCPEVGADGLCVGGWTADRRRCSVAIVPPVDRPRLLTRCVPLATPAVLATPGACCAEHAGCDSNLCVPARQGTACEGGGVCSVPCDPDPFPGGAPGSPADRDRCATFDFGAQSYHQASSCQPFHFLHPYTDRSGQPATFDVELNACQ